MGYSKMVTASYPDESAINSASKIRDFLKPFVEEMGLAPEMGNGTTLIFQFVNPGGSVNIDVTVVSDTGGHNYIGNRSTGIDSKMTVLNKYGYQNSLTNKLCTCHAALSKHKNVLSIGISPSDTSPPYFTETIVKYGDNNVMAIQHGARDRNIDNDYTKHKDFYINMDGKYRETSSQLSLWYRNNDFIAMVPAINPWTNEVIPDLYLATIHPADTRPLRQQITVGGRTFISGLVTSDTNDGVDVPLTFIEI